MNYSSDVLKKTAFNDEIINVLSTQDSIDKMGEQNHRVVLEYLKLRIREIDLAHESK